MLRRVFIFTTEDLLTLSPAPAAHRQCAIKESEKRDEVLLLSTQRRPKRPEWVKCGRPVGRDVAMDALFTAYDRLVEEGIDDLDGNYFRAKELLPDAKRSTIITLSVVAVVSAFIWQQI